MSERQSTCIDCGCKVLSKTRTKKRCPTCEDLHRLKAASEAKMKKRRKLKEDKNGTQQSG